MLCGVLLLPIRILGKKSRKDVWVGNIVMKPCVKRTLAVLERYDVSHQLMLGAIVSIAPVLLYRALVVWIKYVNAGHEEYLLKTSLEIQTWWQRRDTNARIMLTGKIRNPRKVRL